MAELPRRIADPGTFMHDGSGTLEDSKALLAEIATATSMRLAVGPTATWQALYGRDGVKKTDYPAKAGAEAAFRSGQKDAGRGPE